ncbi:MAG: fibronectin type III-like domain-contianing protein [Trebonia sp.]
MSVVVADTNAGPRSGSDVIEGYVHDPGVTGEPPEQLRAFTRVTLRPGQTKLATLTFQRRPFAGPAHRHHVVPAIRPHAGQRARRPVRLVAASRLRTHSCPSAANRHG